MCIIAFSAVDIYETIQYHYNPYPYTYFVSYMATTKTGFMFGNYIGTTTLKMNSLDTIRPIEKYLEDNNNIKGIVITNFQRLK